MKQDRKNVVLKTNYGPIRIELDFDKAPKSAGNFLKCAEAGFYDGTIFHRVIDNFMIQGGGFDIGMKEKNQADTVEAIENEADNGLTNMEGTLAMARTGEPHSATSQFFINVSDNNFLNHHSKTEQGWGYAVFGRVTDGMKAVSKIKLCETKSSGGHQDVPIDDIIIESAEVLAIVSEED